MSALDEHLKVERVTADVARVVARAEALQVTTPGEALEATAFLAEIKAAKTRSEQARLFLVGPLNEQVKRINAVFKDAATPLAAADHLLRGKVVRFRQELQLKREREQARLDAERKQAERQATAERERAEEEARRAEREAAEAERERQAAGQDERRQWITGATTEALRLIAANRLHHDHELAREELAARDRTDQANARMARLRQEAEEATQHSIAVQAAPTIQVAAPRLANGTVGVRRWKATIVDEDQIPREYLIPDMRLINAAVRTGTRDIPGVQIEQVDGLAVRAQRQRTGVSSENYRVFP